MKKKDSSETLMSKINKIRYINNVYVLSEKYYYPYVCFAGFKHTQTVNLLIYKKFIPITDKQIVKYISMIHRYIGGIESYEILDDSIKIKLVFDNMKIKNNEKNRMLLMTFTRYLHEQGFNSRLYLAFHMKEKYKKYRLIDYLLWVHNKNLFEGFYNSNHSLIYPHNTWYNESERRYINSAAFVSFDVNKINNHANRIHSIFENMKEIENEEKLNKIKEIFKNEGISYRE